MNIRNLPPEIMSEIICRLPVRAIFSCKRVCKAWFHLINTREFARHHLVTNSVFPGSGLLVFRPTSRTTCNFIDILQHQHQDSNHLFHYNVSPDLKIPLITKLPVCSTHDLLLYQTSHCFVLCNPITGDSLQLEFPHELGDVMSYCLGLGVSRTTGLHKVVVVTHSGDPECHVYTPETRYEPRRIEASAPQWGPYRCKGGVFVNGKLHWLALGPQSTQLISCFNLETELFSILPAPPIALVSPVVIPSLTLFAWEDRLGLCDNSNNGTLVLWLMKDMECWSKKLEIINHGIEHLIRSANAVSMPEVEVVKIFKDGDMLMECYGRSFYYSKKMGILMSIDPIVSYYRIALPHTPTFFPPAASPSQPHL